MAVSGSYGEFAVKAKEPTDVPGAKEVCRWYVSFVRISGGTTYPAGTRTIHDCPLRVLELRFDLRDYFLREFLLTIKLEKFGLL